MADTDPGQPCAPPTTGVGSEVDLDGDVSIGGGASMPPSNPDDTSFSVVAAAKGAVYEGDPSGGRIIDTNGIPLYPPIQINLDLVESVEALDAGEAPTVSVELADFSTTMADTEDPGAPSVTTYIIEGENATLTVSVSNPVAKAEGFEDSAGTTPLVTVITDSSVTYSAVTPTFNLSITVPLPLDEVHADHDNAGFTINQQASGTRYVLTSSGSGISANLNITVPDLTTAPTTLNVTAPLVIQTKSPIVFAPTTPTGDDEEDVIFKTPVVFTNTVTVEDGGSVTGASPLTTKGDLYTYASAETRLGVGANGKILTAASGETTGLAWGSGPLTTKGDIFTYSTTGARLAVGSNGQFLTADSGEATGLKWATSTATAGGSDTEMQFNNGGALDGASAVTYDDATGQVTIDDGTFVIELGGGTDGLKIVNGVYEVRLVRTDGGFSFTDGTRTVGLANTAGNGKAISVTGGPVFLDDGVNLELDTGTGTKIGTSTSQKLAFWNAAPVVQQNLATLTNNVTSGGTDDQIDTWTSLTVYATDAAAIRDAVYQLARKVRQITELLRTIGLGG